MFPARQRHLERAGCVRCHPRDTDRPAPLEAASSKLGGAYLQSIPFQRTPRLLKPPDQLVARAEIDGRALVPTVA